jgi:bifunctional non-homologous end joining protein LigD
VRAAGPASQTDSIAGSGAEVFAAAEKLGLEGIVSKKRGSRYRSGVQKTWRKTKCTMESELILIGSKLDERNIPSLLLARETEHGLAYVGSAILAMAAAMRDQLRKTCEAIKIERPVVNAVSKSAWWFKPEVRVRVRHLRGEREMLRHATATALLNDSQV